MKANAIEKISKNEDVLFYWSVVSTDWEQWVTVHGFLFTSAFVEKYKQVNKSVQKSKGIRKNLLKINIKSKE